MGTIANNAKIDNVNGEVTNVKTQVASTKTELDKTITDLKKVTGDLGVQIALELEPFKLSLVNNVDTMSRFIDEVDHPADRVRRHRLLASSVLSRNADHDGAVRSRNRARVERALCDVSRGQGAGLASRNL